MTRLADRVQETTSTTGTGTLTLGGAKTGYRGFLAALGAGGVYYAIVSQVAAEWEVGSGTLTASPDALARTTVLASSNAGALVNFTAGLKDVFCTIPAAAVSAASERIIATAYHAAITNDSTETTILSASVASLGANSELRLECTGHMNITSGGATAITWRLKLGGTTIASTVTSNTGMSVADTAFWVTALVTNLNAQNSQRGTLRYQGVSAGSTDSNPVTMLGQGTASLTWSGAQTIALTVQMGTASSLWTLSPGAAVLHQNGA